MTGVEKGKLFIEKFGWGKIPDGHAHLELNFLEAGRWLSDEEETWLRERNARNLFEILTAEDAVQTGKLNCACCGYGIFKFPE